VLVSAITAKNRRMNFIMVYVNLAVNRMKAKLLFPGPSPAAGKCLRRPGTLS
jgi:hypothetical protein